MKKFETLFSAAFMGIAIAVLISAVIAFKLTRKIFIDSKFQPSIFSINPFEHTLKGDINLFKVQEENDAVGKIVPINTAAEPLGKYLLTGVINSGWQSAAIIKNEAGDSAVLVRLGDRIFGSSEHLARVENDAVILIGAHGKRRLYLGVMSNEGPAIQEVKTAPNGTETGIALSRSEINASVSVAEELLGQTQILPEVRESKIIGFRVMKVADNTIVKKMGIQPGDIIKAVNGQQLDSLERSTDVWNKMKSATEIHMLVERNGADSVMSFYLKP